MLVSKRPRLVFYRILNTFPLQENNALIDNALNVLGTFNVLLAITSEFRG